jgi:hypothetical protein
LRTFFYAISSWFAKGHVSDTRNRNRHAVLLPSYCHHLFPESIFRYIEGSRNRGLICTADHKASHAWPRFEAGMERKLPEILGSWLWIFSGFYIGLILLPIKRTLGSEFGFSDVNYSQQNIRRRWISRQPYCVHTGNPRHSWRITCRKRGDSTKCQPEKRKVWV